MIVVTSGRPYIDIDAYAACIAYAELLRLISQNAVAASTSIFNESITPTVQNWDRQLDQNYRPKPNDNFVLIDVSNPEQFDKFVDPEKIIEIIDHHPGHEEYWQQKIGDKADIGSLGAACTQVFERIEKAGKLTEISPISARLLMTGILDNTLYFKAQVTTNRDRLAYEKLSKFAGLSKDWPEQYFNECQKSIVDDIESALVNDTKKLGIEKLPKYFGQLVIWDASIILSNRTSELIEIMGDMEPWVINIVSIGDGKSFFLANDKQVQQDISKMINISFHGNVATADRLWLRKEIMKVAIDKNP